uniref:PAX3- and PAX7-binding protein 1-like n=1 Tax=Styela clava TaxID=7725 RepID=UPI00193AD556|nr:PAX3- and PAX7-binding protein 1-like [Styela clava]
MFKKTSKRNLRQRKDSDGDGIDGIASEEGNNGVNIAALKAKQKKKSKAKRAETTKPEQKAILSFGGDEEEETETFQLKKSSRSRRIAKQIKKLAQEERDQPDSPGSGEYTKEHLAELKKSSMAPQSLQSTNSPSHPFGSISENNTQDSNTFGQPTNGGLKELRPGEIPDANRIHAARKQREMMRKYGSDYIAIENTDSYKTNPNSRLVREDDLESSSGDEDGPSVAMKGVIDDGARVVQEIGNEGEESFKRDEEFDLWEAQMIKKGISTQQVGKWVGEDDSQPRPDNNIPYNTYVTNGTYNSSDITMNYKPTINATPKIAMTPGETVTAIKKRISERLESVKEVHRTHKQDEERAILDVKESEDSAVQLADVTTLSKQYTYFQDMKAYLTDLIDCLSEKNVEIEALEKRRHKIWKEKADVFLSRRQQDVADESSEITCALSNVKIAPSAVDKSKQLRIREREARKSRRRAVRERLGTQKVHIDGTSTDEEENSMDKARHATELDRIEKFKKELFEDVVEDFYDVQIILGKFTDWREKHPDSYNDAFIGLCLPKLLSPFVRLAMLHWNPIDADCIHFEEMQWYKDLLFYGVKDQENFEATKNEPDTKVLSSLYDKVVLPKLTFLVQEIWDPLSSKQSQRLSLLLCRLVRTYPCMRPEHRRCNDLILALCTRMQKTIDNDVFVPLFPTSALTNLVSGPGAFFEKQTWSCIKLFENILFFNGILSPKVLQELAFTSLLNRYIMLSLQTSPITTASVLKCQRIAEAIPTDWLKNPDDIATDLSSFSRYLLHSAKHIHGQLSVCNDQDKRKARSCINQLGKILSHIGSDENSQEVLTLLGIKTLF